MTRGAISNPIAYARYSVGAAVVKLSDTPVAGVAVPNNAMSALIQVLTNPINYRDDLNDPTASEGVNITAGKTLRYIGQLTSFRMIRSAGANAEVRILYYGDAPPELWADTGAGGGGTAVTVADGADTNAGTTTDAALTADAAGTMSAKLRGLVKWAYERMPTSLGAKASTASFPVVLATDQAAVPVSGTLTAAPDSQTITDNQGFTDGTSKLFEAGYIFDETAGTALTENDAAAARVNANRAQVLVIEDDTTRGRRAVVTAANALKTDGSAVTQPISGNITNAGTFAVQDSEKVIDNQGFTDGTTKVLPAGFIFDEAAGTALTENDAAAGRIDSKRAQIGVLEDATTRGQRAVVSAAGALKVDDSAVPSYDAIDGIMNVTTLLPVKRAFANVAASQTDSSLVAAVASKKIRVLALSGSCGATATDITPNTKPAGAGSAIWHKFANGVNGGEILPYNPKGWFESAVGEGLTVTTGAGSTTGVGVNYVEV